MTSQDLWATEGFNLFLPGKGSIQKLLLFISNWKPIYYIKTYWGFSTVHHMSHVGSQSSLRPPSTLLKVTFCAKHFHQWGFLSIPLCESIRSIRLGPSLLSKYNQDKERDPKHDCKYPLKTFVNCRILTQMLPYNYKSEKTFEGHLIHLPAENKTHVSH